MSKVDDALLLVGSATLEDTAADVAEELLVCADALVVKRAAAGNGVALDVFVDAANLERRNPWSVQGCDSARYDAIMTYDARVKVTELGRDSGGQDGERENRGLHSCGVG